MKSTLLIHLVACLSAFARGEPFERQHENVSEAWERLGKSDRDTTITLTIVLASPHDDAFEERAYQIATPFSPFYRKHMTAEELATWIKPTDETVSKVQKWLRAYGIKGVQNHDLIESSIDVSHAEALLNSTYYLYRHRASGRLLNRVQEYSLPESLKEHVEFVAPTVSFMHREPPRKPYPFNTSPEDQTPFSERQDPSDLRTPCNYYTDPHCVRRIYNVTYRAQENTTQYTAIFLYFSGNTNLNDLSIYLHQFNLRAAKDHAKPRISQLGHGHLRTLGEENLDSQLVIGHSWPAKSTYTFTTNIYAWGPFRGGKATKKIQREDETYLKYFHEITHAKHVPSSTTDSEGLPEHMLSIKYIRYLCKIYARAGARGVSVFFPSGDNGSGGYFRPGDKKTVEMLFPADCPWVTTVGATYYTDSTEKACTFDANAHKLGRRAYAGGGGFSKVFSRPKYQEATVAAYLKDHDIVKKFSGVKRFSSGGRGFPDIAAFGQRVPFVFHKQIGDGSGTSASTPISASLITVLNDYESSKGRPALGFLNPWLYLHPHVLNDITEGGINDPFVCKNKTSCIRSGLGYPTTRGWDAVTGLGSINFGKMMQDLDEIAEAGALG